MKNNILKSILATILLLLGVSHTAWGKTIYYVNVNNWESVHCHNWGTDGTAWPGTEMTKTAFSYEGHAIWSVVLKSDNNNKCIFSQNGQNQTQDLDIPDDGYVYHSTGWITKEAAGIPTTYYYRGDKNSWGAEAMTNHESNLYAYFSVDGSSQFKCSKSTSTWDYSSYNNDFVQTNKIDLTTEDGNIKIGVAGYILLYYPKTECNANNDVIICAATTLPDGCPTSSTCTTPPIAWTTEPADGTVGGNMTATVSTNQTSPTVTWSSSNTSVATVDANGKITYMAAGTTTITASYTGDGTTYCAETVSVSKDITVTAAATTLNIYVQGRFKVRTSKRGSDWLYTGDAYGSWNTGSNSIKFEYEEATGYYKLNTYCSVAEYSAKAPNNEGYYFHFKEGSTEYGATGENIKPALEANKRTIQSGSNNFIFTTADCTEGDNVVLYLDWSNKKFWYAVDASTTYAVTISAGTGGSVSPSGEQQVGSTGVAITATPNTGYAFDKWTVVSGNVTIADASAASTTITATSDGEVKATFKTASYLVDYHANGHGTAPADVYVNHGDKAPIPTPPTADDGYTFCDWYTTSECTTKYNFDTPITAKLDLYAKWVKAYTKFFYYDSKTNWEDGKCKQLSQMAEYAYVELNYSDTKFKIFDGNTKQSEGWYDKGQDDAHTVASALHISATLKGDIELKNSNDNNNATFANSSISTTFFLILYYPNTSLNNSCDYVIAASTTLPDAEEYNVTFGVVGNVGGTLTAKSGSSTISSGALVSFATFTATPDVGYAVEGWYSDAEGNNKIDAAGTSTTYSQAITATNNSVYVKFAQVRAVYFKNNHNWSEVHIYTFSNNPFNGDYNGEDGDIRDEAHKKGIGPAGALEKAQMTHTGDDIYMYQLTNATEFSYIAFTSKNQYGYDNFYDYNDVVYRTDHNDATGLFMYIPDKSESANTVNKNGDNHANYFYKGVWMKPNSTDAGYEIAINTNGTFKYAYFTTSAIGGFVFTYDTVLTKGVKYSFFVKNDNNNYFGRGSDAGNTIDGSTNDLEMYLWGSGNVGEVSFTPANTGTYTFTLHLENGRVLIDVLCPEDKYRLVYVEKTGSNILKFHPSHEIKQHHEATAEIPVCDTISMHVRPKVVVTDTADNSNTCLIALQKYELSSQKWKDIQTIDVKDGSFTNGVYNFVVKQDGSSVTINETQTHPYKGRFYIRTDASDGGWNNYKQLKNYCYYTEYSRVYRGFDHYYCHWTNANTNIKYTIACDYSYCVSDTLTQEDHEPHKGFTDENGKFLQNANIRFMWNSFDNTLDRAYIAGRGDNIYLLSESGIYETDGTTLATSVKLEDQENWVYRADIKASTKSRIKLRVLPYNNAGFYSWFRGSEGDFSEQYTEQLIEGKSGNKYTIRVIYDFKTDHLICAWIPDGETISDDDVINADLMIIRKDQGDAAQLKFDPSNKKLTSVTTAFGVITMTKTHLSNESLAPQERGCFWVSFPFDVRLSDVFGCGTYGVDFIIQYYDGESRAKNGCWIDSPTYWRYVENPTNFTIEKGKGYILVVDYDKILKEQFQHSNTEVNIYFPSANETSMDITGELPTEVEIPPHKCEIQRENRYIYDSNWNLIGVPSWANIDAFGNPKKAYQVPDVEQDFYIGFFYDYDAKTKTWTTSAVKDTTFKSMHAYLVQWAGTINWKEKSVTGGVYEGESPAQQALQARRYAPAAEGEEEAEGAEAPEQYTLRLTLHRGEQQLDHTYVRLQEGNVTTDFDLNYDMTKILNGGANLYSLVGTNLIQCAANVQPLQEEAQTISIPLGVVADQDGLYTFSLPDGTEGMNVSLVDNESGTVHNLALGDYQTALTKGTYEQRFALEIQPRQEVSTGCEQTDAAGKSLRKVLIDGNLYILRDGKAYTAAGVSL